MIITTQRLKIIPMSFEYLHDLHKLLSDRELTKFMVFNPKESIEETKIAYNNIFNITNNQKIDLKQEDMIFVCKIFKD